MALEGKKIKKVLELADGLTLVQFEDGTVSLIKVLEPEIDRDELVELMDNDSDDDDSDDDDSDDDDSDDDDSDDDDSDDDDSDDDDSDDKEYTWDDLEEMDEDELTDLIDEEELDIDSDDYDDDEDGLRKAVAKELKITVPKKKKK